MQILIDIPDRIHYGIEKGITVNGSSASQIVLDAVKNGTPIDLEGLKSDVKALNCDSSDGLDYYYLLDCLDKRLGIKIIWN